MSPPMEEQIAILVALALLLLPLLLLIALLVKVSDLSASLRSEAHFAL